MRCIELHDTNVAIEVQRQVGGLAEAVIRSIMYVRMPQGSIDERGFSVLQAIRRVQPANRRLICVGLPPRRTICRAVRTISSRSTSLSWLNCEPRSTSEA